MQNFLKDCSDMYTYLWDSKKKRYKDDDIGNIPTCIHDKCFPRFNTVPNT